jgi:hypothetical protein
MSRLPVRRPSPALVISTLALFVALGGTGYAAIALPSGSVGTKQLKNGAVTEAKVKAHSLGGTAIDSSRLGKVPSAATADTATSATSARFALAATNAVNAVNATKATSAPIANVTYVAQTTPVPAGPTSVRVTANCPSATTVIGGGATVNDEVFGLVNDSFPGGKTSWVADVYDGNTSGSINATVTAICAPAAATAP